MSLEAELEKLEVMLGYQPLEGISHPNPKRKYPGFFSKLFKKIFGIFKVKKKEDKSWIYE